MSKIIMEFNIPEEREEYEHAYLGIARSIIIDELDNWLRSLTKYQDIDTISVNEVRDKISELRSQYEST